MFSGMIVLRTIFFRIKNEIGVALVSFFILSTRNVKIRTKIFRREFLEEMK